ncbi:MAG: hypothetical protein ABJT31_11365 [Hyphomicrobiales bacterium]
MPRTLCAIASLFLILISTESYGESLTQETMFQQEALNQIQTPSRFRVPDDYLPGFQLSTAFPTTIPADTNPWEAVDFKTNPEEYLATVLAYVLEGNTEVDWHVGENVTRTWYHAPWMHFGRRGREPIRGLTLERGARPFELHEDQTDRTKNWAVGFYNAAGATTLGSVWQDPSAPDTRNVVFPVGTVSAKLLFTDASVDQVPYLADSLVWDAQINRNRAPVKMRLLQLDIAVRDVRADTATGWIFGTFVYRADADGDKVWDRLVPVGLHWGNDPMRTLDDHNNALPLSEGWMNPVIMQEFYGLPRKWLGLWGRMNGPVDNSGSACLACHSRAMDLGETRDSPPFAPNSNDAAAVLHYFANRGPTEPFFEGFRSLDYSLQLADGVANYREWVRSNHPDFIDDIYGTAAAAMTLG